MNPDAYMPYYGADFETATKGLRREVKWSYLAACWHYWTHTHCAGLEDEDEGLRLICDCPETDWVRTKGMIFGRMFKLVNGKWHQKRTHEIYDETLNAYAAKVEAARLARIAKAGNKTANKPDNNPDNKNDSNGRRQGESESESVLPISGCGVERTLPPGFPKSPKEAIERGQTCGATSDFLEALWNKAMSRGGSDHKDIPIRSWAHYAANEWGYEQDRIAREKNANSGRTSKPHSGPDRNAGTFNEGKSHLYANAALKA